MFTDHIIVLKLLFFVSELLRTIFYQYLCIRNAALGKYRASSLSSRLQFLCIRNASARQCQAR